MTISNQASDSFVAEVDAQNFQATVIEKSQQVPVVLEEEWPLGRVDRGRVFLWVVEANPEPIQKRQSGNAEGFSKLGEPRRIPIRN